LGAELVATDATQPYRDAERRAAFTLVELLVVISIIALLLSLLTPTLARVKAMGRRTQCQANLRQIHTAATSYQAMYRGALVSVHPPVKMPEDGGDEAWVEPPPGWQQRHPQWPNNDKFCVNDMLRQFVGGGTLEMAGTSKRGNEALWYCPSAFETNNSAWNHRRLDYGLNHYGRGTGETGKYWDSMSGKIEGRSNEGNFPRHASNIGRTTVIWFADAENDTSPEDIGGVSRGKLAAEGGDHWPLQVSFNLYAYIRHLMGYNAVQFDGTAVWYDGERIDPDKPESERAEEARLRVEKWFIYKPRVQG